MRCRHDRSLCVSCGVHGTDTGNVSPVSGLVHQVRSSADDEFPAERLAQLYPGVDLGHAQERFLTQYRALTTGIAVLGLLLLGWLFSYMRRPDWDDGPVEVLVTVYFLMAQMLPLGLVVWFGVRFNK